MAKFKKLKFSSFIHMFKYKEVIIKHENIDPFLPLFKVIQFQASSTLLQ